MPSSLILPTKQSSDFSFEFCVLNSLAIGVMAAKLVAQVPPYYRRGEVRGAESAQKAVSASPNTNCKRAYLGRWRPYWQDHGIRGPTQAVSSRANEYLAIGLDCFCQCPQRYAAL